jgi:hypothetical protein
MSQVLQAVDALNARLVLAEAIGQAFDLAAPEDSPPPWVFVYREQIEAIRGASEALETLLRQLPEDLQ